MALDTRFGPCAQTPAQRANVLRQLRHTYPQLGYQDPSLAQHLFDRYVAGELSWPDVRRALDEALPAPPVWRLRRGA